MKLNETILLNKTVKRNHLAKEVGPFIDCGVPHYFRLPHDLPGMKHNGTSQYLQLPNNLPGMKNFK